MNSAWGAHAALRDGGHFISQSGSLHGRIEEAFLRQVKLVILLHNIYGVVTQEPSQ
jgi:hypothetical protein